MYQFVLRRKRVALSVGYICFHKICHHRRMRFWLLVVTQTKDQSDETLLCKSSHSESLWKRSPVITIIPLIAGRRWPSEKGIRMAAGWRCSERYIITSAGIWLMYMKGHGYSLSQGYTVSLRCRKYSQLKQKTIPDCLTSESWSFRPLSCPRINTHTFIALGCHCSWTV